MKTVKVHREINNWTWRSFMRWARENDIPIVTLYTFCNERYSTGTGRFMLDEGDYFWTWPSLDESDMDEIWGDMVFLVRESDYPLVALRMPASQSDRTES